MKNNLLRAFLLIILVAFVSTLLAQDTPSITFKVAGKTFQFDNVSLRYSAEDSSLRILGDNAVFDESGEQKTVPDSGISLELTLNSTAPEIYNITDYEMAGINIWWPGEDAEAPESFIALRSEESNSFSFEITEFGAVNEPVKGKFSGKLYDENGTVFTVTDGFFLIKRVDE